MFKIGQKVAHFLNTSKVGIVKDIVRQSNNYYTFGGTSESNIYLIVEFNNNEVYKIKSGDAVKIYD